MSEIFETVINTVRTNELSFCKYISPNDAGITGGHQAGVYIPKSAVSIIFDEKGLKGKNIERNASIKWFDGDKVNARFIYYGQGTRNEYRITRLGRILKVGEFFILSKIDEGHYEAFLLNNNNLIDLFNTTLGLDPELPYHLIYPEVHLFFKPRARILLQLGDQLIRNESIALLELIKNSYDADANKVIVMLECIDDIEKGKLIIEDNGYGMDRNIIENVWMEPGSDFKSNHFENLELTPKYKRLPIGEKGIGRFGVHKLGNKITLISKKEGKKEVSITIDWNIFNEYKYLDDVPIKIIERNKPQYFTEGKTGTYIEIGNFRNAWKRGTIRNTHRVVATLQSPFESNEKFNVDFSLFDKPEWLEGLLSWDDIKEYSLFNFEIKIEGACIKSFKYYFTPWSTMSKINGRHVNENDILFKTYQNIENNLNENNIGNITFKGYVFDLDTRILSLGVQDKKTYKDYLRENGGVRVYRDGLRVYDYGETGNDWLGLDIRRVNVPAKRISNNIILGAVYLDRQQSNGLEEKTNREGFVENESYNALKNTIIKCIELIEIYRYSDKLILREIYGPTTKSEPVLHVLSELKSFIDEKEKNEEIKNEVTKYLIKIEDDYKRMYEILLKAAGAGLSLSVVVHEVEKIILEVQKVLKRENASERLVKLIKHLSDLIDSYSQIIRRSTYKNENLKEIIDQALFNSEFRTKAHDITIVSEYRNYNGINKSKVARSLLIGIITNLIDNSIYWLEKANRKSKKIFINIYDNDEGFLSIVVADNGTGFLLPTDEITEPFVSAKSGGMGLGLHIAKEIMSAHKGELEFPEWGEYEIPSEFKEGAIIALKFKI